MSIIGTQLTDGSVTWKIKDNDQLATHYVNGLMSKEDKIKLDSLTSSSSRGFQSTNNNNISSISLNGTTISPDDNNNININLSEYTKTNQLVNNIPTANTTTNGLMSSVDKDRLNSLVNAGGETNKINSISKNGVIIEPDTSKNVNIVVRDLDQTDRTTLDDLNAIYTNAFKISSNISQKGVLFYNGKEQSPTWENYIESTCIIKNTTNTKSGVYTSYFRPILGCVWDDGSGMSIKTFDWAISNIQSIPTPHQSDFAYVIEGNSTTKVGPVWDNYITDSCDILGVLEASNKGTYLAIFIPKEGYVWEDDATRKPKYVSWQIKNYQECEYPKLVSSVLYTGSTVSPTIEYDTEACTMTGATESVNIATYNAIFSLNPGYMWIDHTRENFEIVWDIVSDNVPIPLPHSDAIYYNGSERSPIWLDYHQNSCTITGVTRAIEPGHYTAIFTPNTGYVWKDGTRDLKEVDWSILEPLVIKSLPSIANVKYNVGGEVSPSEITISYGSNMNTFDIDSLKMYFTIRGDISATSVGSYTMNLTPKDMVKWWDGTRETKSVYWTVVESTAIVINNGSLYLTEQLYDNNGAEIRPTFALKASLELNTTKDIENFNNKCCIYPEAVATEPGTYTAYVYPRPGYYWADGSIYKEVKWTVLSQSEVRRIPDPILLEKLYFNNQNQTPKFYIATDRCLENIAEASAVGTYENIFTISDTNVVWESTGTDTIVIPWRIHEVNIIDYPTLNLTTIQYDGTTKSPTWNNYTNGTCIITGTLSAIEPGEYHAYFYPNEGYCWTDYSRTLYRISWYITK